MQQQIQALYVSAQSSTSNLLNYCLQQLRRSLSNERFAQICGDALFCATESGQLLAVQQLLAFRNLIDEDIEVCLQSAKFHKAEEARNILFVRPSLWPIYLQIEELLQNYSRWQNG